MKNSMANEDQHNKIYDVLLIVVGQVLTMRDRTCKRFVSIFHMRVCLNHGWKTSTMDPQVPFTTAKLHVFSNLGCVSAKGSMNNAPYIGDEISKIVHLRK